MARTDPRPHYGTKRRIRTDGYVDVYDPAHPLARVDGYLMEHRKVAWDCGLLTDPSMHVHHIDHDKRNNDPANLAVLSVEQHARHHAEHDPIGNQYGTWARRESLPPKTARQCEGCGGTVEIALRRDARFCSSNCRIRVWKRRARG